MKIKSVSHGLLGVLLCCSVAAFAQTQSAPAPAAAPSPAPAPAPSIWSVGSLDFSGLIDGYYSYNANRPSNAANGQINDLYNFNDKTDQFNLAMAKLTINHNPDPVGVHVDLIFGRANDIMHPSTDKNTDSYIEQAYISATPPKWHGTELDFGQFVTSAGAEVIEAMNDWNYSRSILFAWAIPYYHFGIRTSTPVTKSWTAGVQLVNGWNDVVANNGGVTVGLTSLYTKPKYNWALNYYVGPQNTDTQKANRNLIDTTLNLTPTPKFSAYLNYDYGQNHTDAMGTTPESSAHWQGFAGDLHEQFLPKQALSFRGEFFNDSEGYATGTAQKLKEVTATYEYKWNPGVLTRVEYRRDWSDQPFFHKGNTEMVDAQSTLTVAFIAFFGPKR
uniref:Porin n=1 Tax=Acidobacterium capsulatum TaxID=33075 RepID=A0A7V5CSB1_9BACT